jgi:hypothetical protein
VGQYFEAAAWRPGGFAAEGLIAVPLAGFASNSPARVFPKGDDVIIMSLRYSLERR